METRIGQRQAQQHYGQDESVTEVGDGGDRPPVPDK
jgi:hypothetical protein